MWLLSTDRAELQYFARNFDADGGYAILSHTWVGKEQSFQEVRAIGEQCRRDGTNPRDFVRPKIHNCCLVAEKNGYRWLWIDSCCINKESSSELSEAINSMYQWYKESEVCFAYLADVPRDCVSHAPKSAFRTSRWHTRGWTLQELIAPDFLIFLSTDWHELGNRAALAGLLQEITGVPSRILTGEDGPAEYSVCLRMFWASKRKATRVEDEAYCLMGLFRVSMPTNYGEGKRAFIRLQYEIMQHDSDMSLFAFGYPVFRDRGLAFHPRHAPNHRWRYLIADSPREFDQQFSYTPDLGTNALQQYPPPLESTVTGPFDMVELPRATVTSYGVELRLPIFEADGITIAVILCQGSGRHWGLFLTRDKTGKDPTRPRYFTICAYSKPDPGSTTRVARLVDLGVDLHNITFNGKLVKASWRTIHVLPTPSDLDANSVTTPSLIVNCNPASRFRVPRWLIARLTTLQVDVNELRNTKTLQVLRLFCNKRARVFVSLGSCTKHHNDKPENPPVLWAKAHATHFTEINTFEHDCSEDHIDSDSWATRSKVFGDADRKVRLSFTPSTRMSEGVLVIHLELFGRVFEEMLREADISFPSLADLENNRPRPTPSDPIAPIRPHTLAQIESPSSRTRSPSSSSTIAPRTSPPSIPLPLPNHRPDTRAMQDGIGEVHGSRPSAPTARIDPLLGGVDMYHLDGAPGDVSTDAEWTGEVDGALGPSPHAARRGETETEQLQSEAKQGSPKQSHLSSDPLVAGSAATEGSTHVSATTNGFPWPGAGRPLLGLWSTSRPPSPPPSPLPNPSPFSLGRLVATRWIAGGSEGVVEMPRASSALDVE